MSDTLLALGFILFFAALFGLFVGTVVVLIAGTKKVKLRNRGLYILLFSALTLLASFTLCTISFGH